jgi:hypothetical protein
MAFSYGASDVFGKVNNADGGQIVIGGGSGVTFYDDMKQNGTLSVPSSGNTHSSVVLLGDFSGGGGFVGGGDVFVLGDLRPGNSPATVTYDGNMFLGNSSQTVMELGGTAPGEHDQVIVTGHLTLGGRLDVELVNGYAPKPGDTFDLFEGDASGAFSSVSLPSLPSGMTWDTSHLQSSGTVSVGVPASVPEPSTLALLGMGAVGGIGFVLRRRRTRAAK